MTVTALTFFHLPPRALPQGGIRNVLCFLSSLSCCLVLFSLCVVGLCSFVGFPCCSLRLRPVSQYKLNFSQLLAFLLLDRTSLFHAYTCVGLYSHQFACTSSATTTPTVWPKLTLANCMDDARSRSLECLYTIIQTLPAMPRPSLGDISPHGPVTEGGTATCCTGYSTIGYGGGTVLALALSLREGTRSYTVLAGARPAPHQSMPAVPAIN